MSILYLLIPLSLMLLGLAVWAFFWAVRHDQFEDLEGPAYRILFDDDETDRPANKAHRSAAARDIQPSPPAGDGVHRDVAPPSLGEKPSDRSDIPLDGAVKKTPSSYAGHDHRATTRE